MFLEFERMQQGRKAVNLDSGGQQAGAWWGQLKRKPRVPGKPCLTVANIGKKTIKGKWR